MKRRDFIILTGVGATSGAMLSACGHPEDKLIRAFVHDDEYVPGIDYWKPTTCGMCEAGCGILVRTREYNANKIEGNPAHPINRGGLCARGQAGLQALYNPDRLSGPMKLTGERGSGHFEEIGWAEAISLLASRLSEIKSRGRAGNVVFAAAKRTGVTGLVAEHFAAAYGARLSTLGERPSEAAAIDSYAESYGREGLPLFDIANATYLLSFGARFLETWHSPVMYSHAYAEFRRSRNHARGKFVQVEPRMSLTAANADEWLPAAVGTEAFVALAVAQVIIRETLIKGAQPPAFLQGRLDSYAPEQTAQQTDVPPEKLIRLAREIAAAERPLVIAGGAAVVKDAHESLRSINFLNSLFANLDKPGGVFFPNGGGFDPFEPMRTKAATWSRGFDSVEPIAEGALLIHDSNPAYSNPRATERINSAGFVVSFSPVLDETARLADLILPDNTYLESWDLNRHSSIESSGVGITRPVVRQSVSTKQTADVLIALAAQLGTAMQFESAQQIVKTAAVELSKQPGSIAVKDPEEFFNAFTEQGVWNAESRAKSEPTAIGHGTANHTKSAVAVSRSSTATEQAAQINPGPSPEYPLTLLTYEHAALGMGGQANLPLLQELPDPMTSVMWGNWVEINPKTAASLGIADGDLIEVASKEGSIRAPAVIYPAIRPDVIAIPLGQGHAAYGRYATKRGANTVDLSPSSDAEAAINVKVSRVAAGSGVIRFGTDLWEKLEKKR